MAGPRCWPECSMRSSDTLEHTTIPNHFLEQFDFIQSII
jgi:hypothetical protein